jgi:transposase-like protein
MSLLCRLTVFSLSPTHRRRLRTTNLVERLKEAIRRRTRVARQFPNEASRLRSMSAVIMASPADWQTPESRYATFSNGESEVGV